MISLTDHIEYLISEHDCVIVPGWGAFIAQYTSACENELGKTIRRPERKLGFNPSLDYNDGLLAASIMRKERMSYEEANALISEAVVSIKKQLSHEGEVPFGRLGFFRSLGDGRTSDFESFGNVYGNNYYFGLSNLNIPTLAMLRQEDVEDTKPQVVKGKHLYIPINWSSIQIAASIIVLFVLTFVLTTPISQEYNQDYAGLSTINVVSENPRPDKHLELNIALPESAYKTSTKVENKEVSLDGQIEKEDSSEMDKATSLEKNIVKKINKTRTSNETISRFDDNGNCYLIVASLNTKEMA